MKKILSVMLAFLMFSTILNFSIVVRAVSINDASIFVKQPSDGDGTCVFTSCLNMFRRRAVIDGRTDWRDITHSNYKNTITTNGISVKWTITDVKGMNASMTGISSKTAAEKKNYFISMLLQHPEGIVIYCPSNPQHTVLLTDYTSGTFYCVETLNSYSAGRIPLTSTYIGKGLSQDNAIAKISQIWYITNKSGSPNAPTIAKLSINKTDFKIGENFTMTLSSDTYSQFYLSIFDNDTGERIIGEDVSGTYTNSFRRAGHYVAYMAAFNSKGSVDSNWIDFYVFGSPPTKATFSVNKTELNTNETVTLSTSTNAYYAKVYTSIFKNSKKVDEGNIPYNFEYTPTSPGVYTAYVSAYTHEGSVDSNWVTFYVGKYNVKYNANGGNGVPSAQTKIYGKNLTLSKITPIKKGYIFSKWTTNADGSGTSYSVGANYTANTGVTLYAQWAKEFTPTPKPATQSTPTPTSKPTLIPSPSPEPTPTPKPDEPAPSPTPTKSPDIINTTLATYEISKIAPTETGVELTVTTNEIVSGKQTIIIACYDENGAFIDLKRQQITASDTAQTISIDIDLTNAKTIKAFIWNDIGYMLPASRTKTLDL